MTMTIPQGQPSDSPVAPFQGASIPNRVSYRFSGLDPGANVYIQRDDRLVIQCMSSFANEVVSVNARLLTPGRDAGRTQPDATTVDNPLGDSPFGEVVPIGATVQMGTAYNLVTSIINLAEGYLMSIALSSQLAPVRGQTYARAYILRGTNTITNASYLLCGDYVTLNTPTGFPFSAYQVPTSGRGWLKNIFTGVVSAGNDPGQSPALGARWNVVSFTGTLTTSATAANRIPTFQVFDPFQGVPVAIFPPTQVIPASTVASVTAAPGCGTSVVSPTIVTIPIGQPTVAYRALFTPADQLTIRMATQNIQAGDLWSQVEWCVEEWLDF